MSPFINEIDAFMAAKEATHMEARQNAAFFLMCGIDLEDALRSGGEERRRLIARIERIIERERLKGSRRHWSYDLNRHIALKQAADRLRKLENCGEERAQSAAPAAPATTTHRGATGKQLRKAAPKRRSVRKPTPADRKRSTGRNFSKNQGV